MRGEPEGTEETDATADAALGAEREREKIIKIKIRQALAAAVVVSRVAKSHLFIVKPREEAHERVDPPTPGPPPRGQIFFFQ